LIQSALFENQIIASIKQKAVIDLTHQIEQFELKLLNQLADPANTQGIHVSAEDLQIRILSIQPETEALAVVLQMNATLDLQVPLSVLGGVR